MSDATAATDAVLGSGRRHLVRRLVALAVLGAGYFVAAKLSLTLALVGHSVTPLWPPTGIALVAFLLLGNRMWPAVAVAAFLVNLPISPSAQAAGAIAVGNTLAPLAAASLLRLVRFHPDIDRIRDAISLVALGALASMTVSATIGSLTLVGADATGGRGFWTTWAVWWAGDAMGVLAIAPVLLSLRNVRIPSTVAWRRVGETIALFGPLAAVAALLNTTSRPLWVAVFPLLVAIAWRYQQRGASVAALIVIGSATWAAAQNSGPFAGGALLSQMVGLQVFNATVSLTSFFLAAVVAERVAAQRELQRSTEALYLREHRIAETLQRSLLPERIPQFRDIAIGARYIPATQDVEVGGDWYDVIPLPGESLGLVIGDVAGHGVSAAAAMGQIRMALRAYAHEGASPSAALERLNELVLQLQPGTIATLTYARLDSRDGSLKAASAGHLPPLVVDATGRPRFVEIEVAPPLGVAHTAGFHETAATITEGSVLVFYTDGLIERRGELIDHGLERLATAATGRWEDVEATCDRIVSELLAQGASDDAALLCICRRDTSTAGRDDPPD